MERGAERPTIPQGTKRWADGVFRPLEYYILYIYGCMSFSMFIYTISDSASFWAHTTRFVFEISWDDMEVDGIWMVW